MPKTRRQDFNSIRPLPRGMYDWEYDNFKRHHPQCEPTYKDLAVATVKKPIAPKPLFKVERHQSPYDVIKQMSQDIQEEEEEVNQAILPKKRVTFAAGVKESEAEQKQRWPEWWVKIPRCDANLPSNEIAAWRREYLSQCYGATFIQAKPFLIKQLGEAATMSSVLKLQKFFSWSKQRSNDFYDDIIRDNEDWFKYGPKKRDLKGKLKNELKQTKLLGWLERNKQSLNELLDEEKLDFTTIKKWVKSKSTPVYDSIKKHHINLINAHTQLKVDTNKRFEESERKISFKMTNLYATMADKERENNERLEQLIDEQKEKLSNAFNRNMDELQDKFNAFDDIEAKYAAKIDEKNILIDTLESEVLRNKVKMEELSNEVSQIKENMSKLLNSVSLDATEIDNISAEDIINCMSQL